MKGQHHIRVQNANLRYDFTIRRNIAIIKGDSATGKTTLVEMVRDYYENGENSGITLQCDKDCRVIGGRDWKALLDMAQDSIVFIDEDNDFLPTDEFAAAVRNSDNYYVIVTREGLPNLPYSVTEIYGIREAGKYASLKQTCNEFYRIYGDSYSGKNTPPDTLIVEDSNSGYAFYKSNPNLNVVSAQGKSNVFSSLLENREGNRLVIADGAAFGPEMDRVMKEIHREGNARLFLPESFEWMILNTGLIDGNEVKEILEEPSEHIESGLYFSWERYFTDLLTEKTRDTYLRYSKRKLNPAYLNKNIAGRIWEQVTPLNE